ncbi:MAG: RHS repeat-associated core domain-containing protein, partial [Lachnospiraceae bacterium]|nr:RHS repeat-associated core domain-containing protein [Lachnospiraceae bacterium]
PEAAVDAVMEKAYFQPDLYGSALFASNGQGQVLRYAERGIWGDLKLPVDGDLNAAGLEENLRFTSYGYDSVIGKHFARARFYDSSVGRMLAKDPVKRGLNGYGYCDSDPVNYTDPTGEVANIIAGGFIGAVTGGIVGFGGSALSQIFSGEDFSFKKALGAGANGAIVGGVHGALIGSGVGIGVSLAADFGAGALGSTAEQLIGTGRASAKESIKSGIINAVTGRIYGNGELKSVGEVLLRGAAAGGATSGINYLSDALTPRPGRLGRSGLSRLAGMMLAGATSAVGRDPRRGCETGVRDNDWMGTRMAYGYQYGVTQPAQKKSGFSFADFGKEVLEGAVTGGLASTAFYGAGKVFQSLVGSIRSYKGGTRTLENITEPVAAGPSLVQPGKGYKLKEAAKSISPVEGYTDVAVHGTPDSFGVWHNGNWEYIDQRSLATFLKNNPEYNGGAVRLISCSTGAKSDGIAQQLANKLGVDVLAPSNTLYIFQDGSTVIGPNSCTNTGKWELFTPGKH